MFTGCQIVFRHGHNFLKNSIAGFIIKKPGRKTFWILAQAFFYFIFKSCHFFGLVVCFLPGQADSGVLPSQERLKEIPVGGPRMFFGSCYRAAAKNFLIDHEFSVVFSDSSRGFPETRIGQVCTFCPFPPGAPVKFTLGGFPFKFGGKTAASPLSKSKSFII